MAIGENLTKKQKIFCHEYVIDWNATRAAKEAGYSEKTAYSIGHENLSKPEIQAYIEHIQEDLAKLAGVSALRNIIELKNIAYSTVADFKDGWMSLKDFDSLDETQKSALCEIQYTTKTTPQGDESYVKFKLHDKQRAIEIMNKMLGFNAPDKVDIKDDRKLTEQERLSEIAALKEKLKD